MMPAKPMSAVKFYAKYSDEEEIMSRIGKYPVVIPAGVELSINNCTVTAKGR